MLSGSSLHLWHSCDTQVKHVYVRCAHLHASCSQLHASYYSCMPAADNRTSGAHIRMPAAHSCMSATHSYMPAAHSCALRLAMTFEFTHL
eukprot:498828-Pelagomonas_calceolata.AAC.3